MVGAEPRPESAARHTWIGASCRSPQRGMCHADSYDAALTALGSLISGKQRSHGERWKHAYDGMRVYLEVILLSSGIAGWHDKLALRDALRHARCLPRNGRNTSNLTLHVFA